MGCLDEDEGGELVDGALEADERAGWAQEVVVVVEVVSASPSDAPRDRVQKVDDYAAFGVAWYWIVDPQLRAIEVPELGADGRYARALGATSGSIDVPGCGALSLDLDALWRDLDDAVDPTPCAPRRAPRLRATRAATLGA